MKGQTPREVSTMSDRSHSMREAHDSEGEIEVVES